MAISPRQAARSFSASTRFSADPGWKRAREQPGVSRDVLIQQNLHLFGVKWRNFEHIDSAVGCVEISPWAPWGFRRFADPTARRIFRKGRGARGFRPTCRNLSGPPYIWICRAEFRTSRIFRWPSRNITGESRAPLLIAAPPPSRFFGRGARFGASVQSVSRPVFSGGPLV